MIKNNRAATFVMVPVPIIVDDRINSHTKLFLIMCITIARGSIDEDELSAYLGISREDLDACIKEAEEAKYIIRKDDCLHLCFDW